MLRLFYVCTVLDPPFASICGNGGCEEDMMPIKLIVIVFMHKVNICEYLLATLLRLDALLL